MMVTTHVATGLLLATPVALVAPELALPAALGGAAGGLLPDLDLLAGTHRKTLHFPDYYWVPAVAGGAVAALHPTPLPVAAALLFLAAAVHSASDWFGAGTELRPWERTSDEAVYLRVRDRWLAPRYLVRYDGAPEDFALTLVLAAPGLVAFGPLVRRLALGLVAVAAGYALVRKRLPDVGERLFEEP
ncbi:MAG: metal-dependent hydrolase [Haloferacaceae archaeon]